MKTLAFIFIILYNMLICYVTHGDYEMNIMQPALVFDMETIPCLETARNLLPELALLDDDAATERLLELTKEQTGKEFLKLPLHKIACISFLWLENDIPRLKTFSLRDMDEETIVRRFIDAFAKNPTLISWNGQGFDLPVLLYRATKYGIDASRIFGMGDYRNDYIYKFTTKHIDLMDKYGFGSWGNKQSLNTVAALCGIAGKGDVEGSQVLPMVQAGEWEKLITYCESDVLNTWLLYIRYLQLSGHLQPVEAQVYIADTLNAIKSIKNSDGLVRHERFLQGYQNAPQGNTDDSTAISETNSEPTKQEEQQTPSDDGSVDAVLPEKENLIEKNKLLNPFGDSEQEKPKAKRGRKPKSQAEQET